MTDGEGRHGDAMDEGWTPRVWNTFKKSEREVKKMNATMRSRYQAYEEAPKAVAEAQASSKKRLQETKKLQREHEQPRDDMVEYEKNEKLIGQLKAAEARNRIRIMRLRYNANKEHELNHLISCQGTARESVRLQALVPSKTESRTHPDTLDKISRARVEGLLEDSQGLLTRRT